MNMDRAGIQYHNGLMFFGILCTGNKLEQAMVQTHGRIYIYEALYRVQPNAR